MRKLIGFLLFVIILLGLGAAVFLLGWAQFGVPHGSVGVVRSKTHGVDREPLREGKVRWLWYKLIPGNVRILSFALAPVERDFRIAGNLPSGGVYRSFAALETDFPYEIGGTFSFVIDGEALPALAEEHGLVDQAGLAALEDRLAGEMTDWLTRRFAVLAEREAELEETLGTGDSEGIAREAEGRFRGVSRFRLGFRAETFPDFSLYRSSRRLYEDFLAHQRQVLGSPLNQAAGRHRESQMRLEELARYGELLTRYPVLLQYLAIEKGLEIDAEGLR